MDIGEQSEPQVDRFAWCERTRRHPECTSGLCWDTLSRVRQGTFWSKWGHRQPAELVIHLSERLKGQCYGQLLSLGGKKVVSEAKSDDFRCIWALSGQRISRLDSSLLPLLLEYFWRLSWVPQGFSTSSSEVWVLSVCLPHSFDQGPYVLKHAAWLST